MRLLYGTVVFKIYRVGRLLCGTIVYGRLIVFHPCSIGDIYQTVVYETTIVWETTVVFEISRQACGRRLLYETVVYLTTVV